MAKPRKRARKHTLRLKELIDQLQAAYERGGNMAVYVDTSEPTKEMDDPTDEDFLAVEFAAETYTSGPGGDVYLTIEAWREVAQADLEGSPVRGRGLSAPWAAP